MQSVWAGVRCKCCALDVNSCWLDALPLYMSTLTGAPPAVQPDSALEKAKKVQKFCGKLVAESTELALNLEGLSFCGELIKKIRDITARVTEKLKELQALTRNHIDSEDSYAALVGELTTTAESYKDKANAAKALLQSTTRGKGKPKAKGKAKAPLNYSTQRWFAHASAFCGVLVCSSAGKKWSNASELTLPMKCATGRAGQASQ